MRVRQAGCSLADQALAVGGTFLANVALARTQSKEEYGIFALSYSVFTILSGLHNAAILETYTVYGSGQYNSRFTEYARLLWRSNAVLGLGLTATLTIVWGVLTWTKRALASPAILGLALTCGVLLTATFIRRTFYIRRRPDLAAEFSLVFFTTCAVLLWLSIRIRILSGFYIFVIAALAWITAGVFLARELPGKAGSGTRFTEVELKYWSKHWKYSRWVLVTALVFQLTTQGYYWLVAGFLSAKEVGELRAMHLLVAPVDQAFIALSYLVVPALAAHYAAKRTGSFLSLWKRFALATAGASALFALAVRVAGKPVLHVLYAGKYDDLAPFLFVLALLPLVMWVGSTMGQALNAVEQPRLVFWAYVCSGAATILGGIPLVIHYGLRGAVYGMLLSGAAYTVALAVGFFLNVYNKDRWQTAGALEQGLTPQPPGEER